MALTQIFELSFKGHKLQASGCKLVTDLSWRAACGVQLEAISLSNNIINQFTKHC